MPDLGEGVRTSPQTWGEFRLHALTAVREVVRGKQVLDAPRVVQDEPLLSAVEHNADDFDNDVPVVSIVMPTWNRSAVVREAIESVQSQTLTNWELLVVDDGSDDDTLSVLEEIAAQDERIRIFAEPHVGVCHARNVGIASARGRYLAFLDSDNTWNSDFLRAMTGFLRGADVRWAHAAMKLIRNDGVYYRAFQGDHDHLLGGNYIDLNVMMAEREAIEQVGGFDESLRRAVDYDLILRLSAVWPPSLVPVVGATYADDADDGTRISVAEPFRWSTIVRLRHWMERARKDEQPLVSRRVTIVVPVRQHPCAVMELLDELSNSSPEVEIVLVAAGATQEVERILQVARVRRHGIRYLSLPVGDLFGALNYGAAHATGEYLVTWSPNCSPQQGWCEPLVAALSQPDIAVAQPMQMRTDGLIGSAGGVFVGDDPFPAGLLEAMPLEDAAALPTGPVPTVRSDVMAVRTDTFRKLEGFDLWFGNAMAESDLALRARETGLGEPVVVPSSKVVAKSLMRQNFVPDFEAATAMMRSRHRVEPGSEELWNSLGFDVTGFRTYALPTGSNRSPTFGASAVVSPRLTSVIEGVPMLRWAIDTAAPAGDRSKLWGDLYFGHALAESLRRLGQQVHVDNREHRNRPHRDLDDVTLVLRGLQRPTYRPGSVRLMWVISHPDLVTQAECSEYERVFAASLSWSADRSRKWNTLIEPLLQCTDRTRFTPDAADPDSSPYEIVFVGNSRNESRPAVLHTIAAGRSPVVFGGGWAEVIDDALVAAPFFSNYELPALYASAGVVLNDHWQDMKDEGFISNRVFDVLACGGRLLTDEPAGFKTLFGSAVTVFRSAEDVAAIFSDDWRSHFPDRDSRLATAATVRNEHSFDNRARALLDAALEARAARS